MTKKILMLTLSLFMFLSFSMLSFAEDIKTPDKTFYSTEVNGINYGPSQDALDDITPKVSTEDASSYMERKGFEVVSLLQKFMQPFAIVMFILFAFMVLIGIFGSKKMMSGGLVGIMFSVIAYAAVLYAPEIMDAFLTWVGN